MKQFAISVFLLLFHYCLAPHFACPKEQPFMSSANKCGSFTDICIKYRSEECKFGIRACQQCPLSNFSSAILDRVLRIMYGGENINCSQRKIKSKQVQEFPANGILWIIFIIVSLVLIFLIPIFLYTLRQYKTKTKTKRLKEKIEDLESEKQYQSDEITSKNRRINEFVIEVYEKQTIIDQLKKDVEECTLLKNEIQSLKNDLEKKFEELNDKIAEKQQAIDIRKSEIDNNRKTEEDQKTLITNLNSECKKYQEDLNIGRQDIVELKDKISEQQNKNEFLENKIQQLDEEVHKNPNNKKVRKMKSENPTEISLSWIDAKDGFYPSGSIEVAASCLIIRAKHGEEYIPGLLIKGSIFALISYGGKTIQITNYQVLVDTSISKKPFLEWNYTYGQNIPSGAIIGGTNNGKPLYIAKSVFEGKYVIGKFQPEDKCAYFPVEPNEFMESGLIRVLCHAKT